MRKSEIKSEARSREQIRGCFESERELFDAEEGVGGRTRTWGDEQMKWNVAASDERTNVEGRERDCLSLHPSVRPFRTTPIPG